jgi:hypothetical protein
VASGFIGGTTHKTYKYLFASSSEIFTPAFHFSATSMTIGSRFKLATAVAKPSSTKKTRILEFLISASSEAH